MAVRILVVEATRTGLWAWRCHSTAPVAASMTTAVRASTFGAVGAVAAAGIAIHPVSRHRASTRHGNHRWRERTPVGCTNPWKKCNTLDPDGITTGDDEGGAPDGGGQRRAPPPGDRRELGA